MLDPCCWILSTKFLKGFERKTSQIIIHFFLFAYLDTKKKEKKKKKKEEVFKCSLKLTKNP
jgi:hypothetical protein